MFQLLASLVGVFVGWFLGLASTLLFESWKNRKRIRSMKSAVSIELREAAFQLTCIYYLLTLKNTGLDRGALEWQAEKLRFFDQYHRSARIHDDLGKLLELSDDELARRGGDSAGKPEGMTIPPLELPYCSIAVAQAHDFDPLYTVQLLEILSSAGKLNNLREELQYFIRLTFSSQTNNTNFAIVNENATHLEQFIANQTRELVDKITRFEREFTTA